MSQNGLPQIISNVPQVFYEIMAYYTASVSMLLAVALLFISRENLSGFICGNDVELWFILVIAILPLYAYGQTITLLAWLLVDVWIVTPFVMGLERQPYEKASDLNQQLRKTSTEWFPISAFCRWLGWHIFSRFVNSHQRNRDFLWSAKPEGTERYASSSSKLLYDIRLANPGLVDTLIKEYARCDLAKASALNAFLLAVLVPLLFLIQPSLMEESICGPWLPRGLWFVAFLLVSLLFSIEYYFRKSRTNTHVLDSYQAVMDKTQLHRKVVTQRTRT